MRLDLELIEVFCCVYEEGGFSKAAARLLISQPTVSGHIKNLESYINAKLFDRLPRRLVPTKAGEILYRHGRAILSEKRSAIQELTGLLGCTQGTLNLAASTIPGEYFLPPLVAAFHAKFPAIRIDLRVSDSQAVCAEALQGRTDVGFVGAKPDAIGLEYHRLASDELVLVVPNTGVWRRVESVTLDRLSQIPFLAREPGSGTRSVFEKRAGRSMNAFNVVGFFSSSNAIKEAVKAGLGVAVLSNMAVRAEVASGLLKTVQIEGVEDMRREFYTVVNRNLTRSPIAEAFVSFVQGERTAPKLTAGGLSAKRSTTAASPYESMVPDLFLSRLNGGK